MKKLALLLVIPLFFASKLESEQPDHYMELVAEPLPAVSIKNELAKKMVKEPAFTCLGEFTLTAYCSCSKCCGRWATNRPQDEYGNDIVIGASGDVLTADYSIAVDTDVIPYNTVVTIAGKEYEAQDTGGAIKGNKIDVYFNDHEAALAFGVKTAKVYIEEER